MNEDFLEILEVSEDLSKKGGVIFGSTAWRVQTHPNYEGQIEEPAREIDVYFPLGGQVDEILSDGYEKVNGVEVQKIKKILGCDGIEDPHQYFFKRKGIIIDVSTRPHNYESEIVKFEGYEMRLVTKKQLLITYKKASERSDIPEKRAADYKKMFNLLLKLE